VVTASGVGAGNALAGVVGGSGAGVFGSTATGFGVAGSSSSSGTGVKAQSDSGTGLDGSSGSGTGVHGSSGSGISLRASNPTTPGAHLLLDPAGASGPPATGAHALGQFWMDSLGVLWQCMVAGTPGTWVRQASLVPLAAPFRVYDSRTGQPNPSGSPQGTLAFGAAARTIDCSPAVPTGTSTILFNLTVTGTAGSHAGALLVWAAGVSQPLSSSINWSGPGTTLANAVTSACDTSRHVQVRCVASAGSSTHFLLDVIGYYL
jgi:hypothetical protein